MSAPSVNEMKDAFKDTLERRGQMRKLRASLRSELFKCFQASIQQLEKGQTSSDKRREKEEGVSKCGLVEVHLPTKVPSENRLIDQLFVEYLEFYGYSFTLSTFMAESSGDTSFKDDYDHAVSRKALESDLGLNQQQDSYDQHTETAEVKIPLISGIIKSIK